MQIQKTHFNLEACLKQFERKKSFAITSAGKTALTIIICHGQCFPSQTDTLIQT